MLGGIVAVGLAAGTAVAIERGPAAVGPRPDGTAVLPTGWTVTPAGRQIQLGEKPFGTALSPDGHTMLVSNDGDGTESLQVIDAATGSVKQTIPYTGKQGVFIGVAWSPDGKRAFASAGGNNEIRVYDVQGQTLTERAPIPIPKAATGPMANPFPAGIAVSADGTRLYVAEDFGESMSVIDANSGAVTATVPVGHNPYGVQLSADGRTAFVSNWGGLTVTAVDTRTDSVRATIDVGTHPSAMTLNPVTGEVYVANSDSDTVSVIDAGTLSVTRTIDLAPYPNAPVGTSPNALTVSPDGQTLYVANAGDDDVAVVRLAKNTSADGADVVAGLIPTGWYPTGVEVTRDGRRLLVTNAKGLGAGPNPGGPNPYRNPEVIPSQYVGSMILGSLSVIDVPSSEQLAHYTGQVRVNDGFDGQRSTGFAPGMESVIPRTTDEQSPIKHVIYIIKENRTYDQVLGDLDGGNGDPSLALFGQDVTPNQHQLARQFVTLDNFYADAAVSGDGWQWSAGGYANTYNEKTWPNGYSNRGRGHDFEYNYADAPGKDPKHSYLWDRVINAGLTQRHYGFWTDGGPGSAHPRATAPELAPYIDPDYTSWNMNITDRAKVAEWAKEYDDFEASDSLPAFEMMSLPNDHTNGTGVGVLTPKAMVADNDYALGQLVDHVSHSKDWKDTAIFVLEDDGQAGPDHVDAHRIVAQVISPYTQIGKTDSTLYSTVSMLRTIELILGLKPMTQFDAAATPMLNSFTTRPDFTPYTAQVPRQSLDERNGANAPMAAQSASWDFSQPDMAPEQLLNTAIWQSVKGAGTMPPAPRDHGRPVAANHVTSFDSDGDGS